MDLIKLKSQHQHQHKQKNKPAEQNSHNNNNKNNTQQQHNIKLIPQQNLCPQFLQNLLKSSSLQLNPLSNSSIHKLISFSQQKIYQSFLPSQSNQYLSLIFSKNPVISQNVIKQLISQRQQNVMKKIKNNEIQIIINKQTNDQKIKRINNQLQNKIKQMNKQIKGFGYLDLYDYNNINNQTNQSSLNTSSIVLKQNLFKKQYWKSQQFILQQEKIKQFLKQKKKQKSQRQNKFHKDLQLSIKKHEKQKQKQQQQKHEQFNKRHQQIINKQYKQKSIQRRQYFQTQSLKQHQNKQNLSRYHIQQPIHIRYQKSFHKYLQLQQSDKQSLILQLKKSHPNYNPQQIQQHISKYNKYKNQYSQQKQQKQQLQSQILTQRELKLKQLFHSKYHQSIQNNGIKKQKQKQLKKLIQNKNKIIQYSNTIKEKYKPKIDQEKKQQIQKKKILLQLQQSKIKRKVIKQNGQIIWEDKRQNNSYQKGVNYLQQLRKINQLNKSKTKQSTSSSSTNRQNIKQRSISALQLSENIPKKIDYLRTSRNSLKLKPTISDWKSLLSNPSFTTKDKLQTILNKADTLQTHAKQKSIQLRNMKKKNNKKNQNNQGDQLNQNVLDLKQQADRYYLQSIAARMVMLKDVMQ